jgi:uncharacterized SAM-binding protein YcdF (DUF218 family)
VVTFWLACAVFAVFAARVAVEPRSFGNAVLLGLALALGALGFVQRLAGEPGRPAHLLLVLVLLAVAVGPLAAGAILMANGVTMIRRESARPANLLSLAAGAAVFVVIGVDFVSDRVGSVRLSLLATALNLLFAYVSFLLVSYVCYAYVYGKVARTDGADFVVVLGAGLRPDGRVTPLLASRLDRGAQVWAELDAKRARGATGGADAGFAPALIVSGGKGSDERRSEAAAMADYLTGRGFPAGRLLLEDRSRSTEENLVFSQAIMDEVRPGARVTVVTSDFHAFRAALLARRLGIRGQVTGARVAGYYRPSALLREFAAVFLRYRLVNLAVCAVLVLAPPGLVALQHIRALL